MSRYDGGELTILIWLSDTDLMYDLGFFKHSMQTRENISKFPHILCIHISVPAFLKGYSSFSSWGIISTEKEIMVESPMIQD